MLCNASALTVHQVGQSDRIPHVSGASESFACANIAFLRGDNFINFVIS